MPESKPHQDYDGDASQPPRRASAAIIQQQKTRRRRGSLRKAALLGRGAQRDRRDSKPLTIDTLHATSYDLDSASAVTHDTAPPNALGLTVSQAATQPLASPHGSKTILTDCSASSTGAVSHPDCDPVAPYTSTDEDDVLHISHNPAPLRQGLSMSSTGSESYFSRGSAPRRQAKSPLSYGGLPTTPLPPPDTDWDYSETEWWGWVVLTVTWFVFVIGMGSCLGVWSWAWDVGKTPYAPPELEDDPTLPIVGYYPALIILTCIMAWVWVVVAWVGMKYFRHAKISGD